MMQLVRDHERSKDPNDDMEGYRIGPYVVSNTSLGLGCTGDVKLATCILNGRKAAVKIITKTISRKNRDAEKEVSILRMAEHHDNIIKLEHVEEDYTNIYIFTPYYDHGDLFTYIDKHGTFEEEEAKYLFRQMVDAVDYCHTRLKICHHDVKLENFVLNHENRIALIDFGFAVQYDKSGMDPTLSSPIRVFDTSPAYSPIEVLLHKPHDESVDIYGLGVCLYYMLHGFFPFCKPDETTREELVKNLKACRLKLSSRISSSAKQLLTEMLSPPKYRCTVEQIRRSKWLTPNS